MPQLFNRVGMSSSTTGTGTLALGAGLGAVAVNSSSWQSFATAAVPDGTVVSYLILDSNGNWEAGTGTYSVAGTTLTRTPKYSSSGGAAIALSGTNVQVFITALAADGGDVLGGTTFPMRGFDTPVNLSLTASSDGTLLTVNVLGNNGSNPSPTNPVFIPFRDSTAANGDPIWRIITSALSINTNSAGASLGSIANTAFRFWVLAFDNGGTVALGLINCLDRTATAVRIFPLTENLVSSTTNMSGTATNAGTIYTTATLANKSFRVIGFVEYSATGLATPGTYTRAPDFMQLFGPAVRLPGDLVQRIVTSTATPVNVTTTTKTATNVAANITPTSAANVVEAQSKSDCCDVTGSQSGMAQIGRNSNANMIGSQIGFFTVTAGGLGNADCFALDQPNTLSSTNYAVYINGGGPSTNFTLPATALQKGNGGTAIGYMILDELMG